MTVSIIILSFNTRDLLASCIESVITHTKNISYEIIVVDNNSHDGSAEYIEKKFPKVQVIKNPDNAGFAKGVNIGATHANGEYLLFLNSDAQVSKTTISALRESFDLPKKVGIVGGLLINTDGSAQRSYSRFYDIFPAFLLLFGGDRVELVGQNNGSVRSVDWVSGGCMMIQKKIFEQVGRFDEGFFMYLEDMELCKRVHEHGYSVMFNPHAKATHIGHGSSSRQFAITHIYKGLIYYYRKHKNAFSLIILKIMLGAKAIAAIVAGMLIGKREFVQTYRAALQTL